MDKFCKTLTSNAFKIIKYEHIKILPVTFELYEFDMNHKVCYISEKEFQNKDKNVNKVKHCCRYWKT